jgi:hypothetical protein
MSPRIALPALALLLVPVTLMGQRAERPPINNRIWLSTELEYALNKDWELGLRSQLRQEDNGLRLQQVLGEVQLAYNASKRIKTYTEFRYSARAERNPTQRLALGLSYDLVRERPWYLSLRGQYQHELDPANPDEGNWRTKIRLRYRINKRWSLYASTENWSQLYPYPGWSARTRSGLGLGYGRKSHEISADYFFQQSGVAVFEDPGRSQIVSLKYAYRL